MTLINLKKTGYSLLISVKYGYSTLMFFRAVDPGRRFDEKLIYFVFSNLLSEYRDPRTFLPLDLSICRGEKHICSLAVMAMNGFRSVALPFLSVQLDDPLDRKIRLTINIHDYSQFWRVLRTIFEGLWSY